MKRIAVILLLMALVIISVLADDQDTLIGTSTGNVDIGNPTPRVKLDVNGCIMDQSDFVMPAGPILPYSGTSAPTGWLLYGGTAYRRIGAYADLFNVIETAFRRTGRQHF